jgi:tetratricopeptide (TPR) repeat protein
LGSLAWGQADYAAARSSYEETVALRRAAGDSYLANYLNALGNVLCEQGHCEQATALFEECLQLSRERGHKRATAGALVGLGGVAGRQGDYETARSLCEQGLAIFQEVGDRWGIAQSLTSLASVAHAQCDYGRARRCREQSLVLASELEKTWGSAASLGPWSRLGNPGHIAECLEGLAGLATVGGLPERAARLFGAAQALRGDGGPARPPADQLDYDRNVAAARAALGEEAFAAAWAAGRERTREEAIRDALEGCA